VLAWREEEGVWIVRSVCPQTGTRAAGTEGVGLVTQPDKFARRDFGGEGVYGQQRVAPQKPW